MRGGINTMTVVYVRRLTGAVGWRVEGGVFTAAHKRAGFTAEALVLRGQVGVLLLQGKILLFQINVFHLEQDAQLLGRV